MPDFTSKLLLIKPTTAENADIAQINANMDEIDSNAGAFICTSTTRPTGTNRFSGQFAYETDKHRLIQWDATNNRWIFISGQIDWKPMELNQPAQPLSRIGGVWPGGFSATAVGIGIGPGHRVWLRLGRIKFTGSFAAGNFVQMTKLAGSDALVTSTLTSAQHGVDGPIWPAMAHATGTSYSFAIYNLNADGTISARVGATITDPNIAVEDISFECPLTVGV